MPRRGAYDRVCMSCHHCHVQTGQDLGVQLLHSARAPVVSIVHALTLVHMLCCRAWGAGELGDEFFDWLDWSHSAGIAVFLDVVLEAHRLGDDHLQKFVDYFGKRPAAELLPSVVEVSPESSRCSCWVPPAPKLVR